MDPHQPQVSTSPSQNGSSQVSTLNLNISHREDVERDDIDTAENDDDDHLEIGTETDRNDVGRLDAEETSLPSALPEHCSCSNTNDNQNLDNSAACDGANDSHNLDNSAACDGATHNTNSDRLVIQPVASFPLDSDRENVKYNEDLIGDFYHVLCESHFNALEELIFKFNVDVNLVFTSTYNIVKRMHFGWRAIHIAASRGSARIVTFLLQQGSDLNLLTVDGDTALHIAAKNGCAEVLQVLLEYDVFLRDRPNCQGITALLKAVFNSHHVFKGSYHQCVNLLLGAGCNPNISSSSLVTALHVAVENGDENLVERLINAGANVSALCANGSSPLLRALIAKHINTKIVSSLLLADAKTNIIMNGRSLLHIAVSRCDDRLIETFVKLGADTNFLDNSGRTPLWIAVEENNIKVVPILISGGADIEYLRQPKRLSILSQAVKNNSLAMVKLLLSYGASPYTESFMWSTPLHIAVDKQNIDIVRELLKANCPLDTYSNAKFALKPMTPVQLAVELGHVEIVFLLLQCGSHIKPLYLRKDRMPPSLASNPDFLYDVQMFLQQVPPLVHLSRLCIREYLAQRFTSVVSQMKSRLLLPSKIIDYLSLEDILN